MLWTSPLHDLCVFPQALRTSVRCLRAVRLGPRAAAVVRAAAAAGRVAAAGGEGPGRRASLPSSRQPTRRRRTAPPRLQRLPRRRRKTSQVRQPSAAWDSRLRSISQPKLLNPGSLKFCWIGRSYRLVNRTQPNQRRTNGLAREPELSRFSLCAFAQLNECCEILAH